MNTAPKEFLDVFGELISGEFIKWLTETGFFIAPASTKYHGNYAGGLYDHSQAVMAALVEFTKNLNLNWQSERSPYIVGMFHDLCKIDSYRPNLSVPHDSGEPILWEYNPNTFFTGHGDKSVILLSQHIQLTEEEALCIRYHMGAFTEKEEWQYYSRAVETCPNVLYTHTADMVASKIIGI